MTTRQSYVGKADYANTNAPTAATAPNSALLPDERLINQSPPNYFISAPVELPEIWKPFPGYERRYQISNLGRACTACGLIMSPSLHPDGYQCVWLLKPRRQNARAMAISWAVAIAFLANPLGYPFIKHIDGDVTNNQAINIVWCGLPTTDLSSLSSSTLPSHD